ncbi:hypothetical protein BH09PSE4_BH09PSE4_07400 [soil metagenome]
MTALLLFLALLCLATIGVGVALLRATPRPAVGATGWWATTRAWGATIRGKRAIATALTIAAAILFTLILALRP